jgi:multiple sugar transport system substrate-binding protein
MDLKFSSRRAGGAVIAAALATSGLAACGASASATPTLGWYYQPDNGGTAILAQECSDGSNGEYKITTHQLPVSSDSARQQLVVRLAAGDSSISMISLDPIYIPEFAQAGFLEQIPDSDAAAVTKNAFQPAINAARWDGKLYGVPWQGNVQLLWYSKPVVKAEGLDMAKPVTWDQIIDAAKADHKTIAAQGALYEGYAVWINALVQSAGGKIVLNPGAQPDKLELGLDSKAGETAAAIIAKMVSAGVSGPALSTEEEAQSLALFQGSGTAALASNAGFMVNWPYVWAAFTASQRSEVGFTQYPEAVAGMPAKIPFGGIALVGTTTTKYHAQVLAAEQCLSSPTHQEQYLVHEASPMVDSALYSLPATKSEFPDGLAAAIVTAEDHAGPRPQSQFYNDLSSALETKFSPPDSVNSSTPATAQKFILQVLKGQKLI